jgi:hypothetical protein
MSFARRQFSLRPAVALAILAAGLFCLYLSSVNGIVSSNDGSQFATARSLALYHTTALQDGALFALNDVATGTDGTLYANRPPGTAMLAVPLYLLGRWYEDFLARPAGEVDRRWVSSVARRLGSSLGRPLDPGEMVRRFAAESGEAYACSLLAVLAGIACCGLSYVLARQIGISATAALTNAAVLGFGTLIWRYSTALFSHVLLADLLLAQLLLLISGRATASSYGAFLFGSLAGLEIAMEYHALATLPLLVGLFLWWHHRSGSELPRGRLIFYGLAPILAVLIFLGHGHALHFGSPLKLAITSSSYLDDSVSFGAIFAGSPRTAIWFLFLAPRAYSLLSTSPIFLLAAAGLFAGVPKSARPILWSMAAITAFHIAPLLFKTIPWGGLTGDHRYMVRVLPLLLIPLGFAIDRWRTMKGSSVLRNALLLIFILLVAASVYRSLESVAYFASHAARLTGYREPGIVKGYAPEELVTAAFPALRHPHFLIFGLTVGISLLVAAAGLSIACFRRLPDRNESRRKSTPMILRD